MGKNLLIIAGVIGVSLISVFSLLTPGLHPTHDGEYHVIRFYEFYRVIESGVIYPRIAPDLNFGYGVPLFNFVYPLPNYIGSFFHLFGFSFIDSFKFSMVTATVIGALGMYVWSSFHFGRLGGIVSSVIYSFAPYRLLDIFIRGSVGEIWALALVPYLLYLTDVYYKTTDKRYLPVICLLIALLVFSHNILALLFFVFYMTYIVFHAVRLKSYRPTLLSGLFVVLGLGLSSVFWLPALLEKQFVRGLEIFSVERHFVELYQLLIPSWGSGFSGETSGSSMSYQIGIINIFIILSAFFYLFTKKREKPFVVFLLIWIVGALFLMLPFSRSVWEIVPLLNFFQFPWRLLSLVIILCAFLGGIVSQIRFRKVISGIIIVCSVLLSYSYTIPAYFHNRDDSYYTKRPNFIYGTNSPGNVFNTVWIEQKDDIPEAIITSVKPDSLSNISIQPERYSFDFSALEVTKIIINSAYFPGWIAYTQFGRVPVSQTDDGTMEVFLPAGEYRVMLVFADTIVRHTALTITFLSFLIICVLTIRYTFYENRNR